MDIVIKNGTVVNAGNSFKADVGIQKGKIIALGESLSGTENIDATGKYILPGLIEVYSDLESSFGHTRSIDNFFRGSQAAACGGITTLIDRVTPQADESLSEALKNRVHLADTQMAVDYSFHIGIPHVDDAILSEIPKLVAQGYPSLEIHLVHRDPSRSLSDQELLQLAQSMQETGALLLINCGNQVLLNSLRKQYKLSPDADAIPNYPLLWPPEAEAAALLNAISILRLYDIPTYFHNLTTNDSIQTLVRHHHLLSRCWSGSSLHYLTHDDRVYSQPNARNYAVTPPLRAYEDTQSLWAAVKTGIIQIISSSHRAFTKEQKKLGEDLAMIPSGLANLAMLFPVLHHLGVNGKRISLTQLVSLLSTQPAHIFGLTNKGAIAIGKDADILIFDPSEKKTLSHSMMHSESNFCAYEGLEVQGVVQMTLCRGKIVAENGRFVGEQGAGQLVSREF